VGTDFDKVYSVANRKWLRIKKAEIIREGIGFKPVLIIVVLFVGILVLAIVFPLMNSLSPV
jgi:hypothetical protein